MHMKILLWMQSSHTAWIIADNMSEKVSSATLLILTCFPQEQREREKQDLELAKEMAEEEDDGFPWASRSLGAVSAWKPAIE